ncbi:MAG: hypothetical protein AAB284_02510, partial [Chloroflexota bacterium]
MRWVGVALLFSLFVAACGAPAAQPSPTPTPSPPAAGPSLMDLIRAGKAATYKVTVKVSRKSAAGSIELTQTFYVKPPKQRVDSFILSLGPAPDNSIYVLENGVFTCAPAASAGGMPSCSPMPEALAAPIRAAFLARDPLVLNVQDPLAPPPADVEITPRGTREIAGQQVTCFETKSKTLGAEGTLCYTAQGVALL